MTVHWSVPEKRAVGLGCQLKVRECRAEYSTWTEDAASYAVEGKASLADEKWAETSDSNRAGLRFFRVRVTPK